MGHTGQRTGAAFVLPGNKYRLDLSYAQIADVVGIAQGTVMSRLHRSRLALKEALDKDGQ